METQPEFSMEEWYEVAAAPDSVTMGNFDRYVDEYLDERDKADKIEAELTAQNKKVMSMQSRLMEYLDLLGKTKHNTSRGSIIKIETTAWRPPEGEERLPLLQMLKEKGEYDAVMAFNAAKFNTWYKQELEANPQLRIAGVEQKVTRYIRKGK